MTSEPPPLPSPGDALDADSAAVRAQRILESADAGAWGELHEAIEAERKRLQRETEDAVVVDALRRGVSIDEALGAQPPLGVLALRDVEPQLPAPVLWRGMTEEGEEPSADAPPDPLLLHGGVAVFGGVGGIGKSAVTLSIGLAAAHAAAAGEAWGEACGMRVRGAPVLMCGYEDDAEVLRWLADRRPAQADRWQETEARGSSRRVPRCSRRPMPAGAAGCGAPGTAGRRSRWGRPIVDLAAYSRAECRHRCALHSSRPAGARHARPAAACCSCATPRSPSAWPAANARRRVGSTQPTLIRRSPGRRRSATARAAWSTWSGRERQIARATARRRPAAPAAAAAILVELRARGLVDTGEAAAAVGGTRGTTATGGAVVRGSRGSAGRVRRRGRDGARRARRKEQQPGSCVNPGDPRNVEPATWPPTPTTPASPSPSAGTTRAGLLALDSLDERR